MNNLGISNIIKERFHFKNGDVYSLPIKKENVHFVDVNNDGQKDIVYQDDEYYDVIAVFVYENGDYFQLWTSNGKLIDIIQGDSTTTIYAIKHDLGCDDIISLNELKIDKKNTLTSAQLYRHSETTIKNVDSVFQERRVSGMLRKYEIADTIEIKDSCTGKLININYIQTLDNEVVTVIKQKHHWLQVVYNKGKNGSIIGWIEN